MIEIFNDYYLSYIFCIKKYKIDNNLHEVIVINKLESTTIWDFPDRGNWLNHDGKYRGNWSPHVPKNLIIRYSSKGDIVLDPFIGGGTTLIEACRLERRCIALDINENAIKLCNQKVKIFNGKEQAFIGKCDARNLSIIKDNSIDLICTHPPYSNIIKYSKNNINDISLLELDKFYIAMKSVSESCYRVLKNNKYCCILIADIRKKGFIEPLGFKIMNIFMEQGFRLKEIIIKKQNNCKSTNKWKEISKDKNIYLIEHEYLFVFYKN